MMPALDGTSIVAIGSFAALILAWLFAPSSSPVATEQELHAAA